MGSGAREPVWTYLRNASLGLLGLAFLLHLISFSAPYWASTNHHVVRKDHIGLWRYCTQSLRPNGKYTDICDDFINIVTEDWLKATQAFMTLAMFAQLATFGAFAMFILVPDWQDDLRVLAVCFISSLVTTIFYTIALLCFGKRFDEWFALLDPAFSPEVSSLDWGFYLAATACFLTFAAPFLLLPDAAISLQMEKDQKVHAARSKRIP